MAKQAKANKKKRKIVTQPILDHYPEGDARILAEASAIKADKSRLSRAKKASVKLIKERQIELDQLKKILNGVR